MSDLILASPLFQRVAAQATSAAQAVAATASETVSQQWQQFEEEAAKTDQWRAEQKLAQQKQREEAAEGGAAAASSDPTPARRIEFSIEDDPEEPPPPEVLAEAAAEALAEAAASVAAAAAMPAPAPAAEPAAAAEQAWELRLRALVTILEQEEAAAESSSAAAEAPPTMPRSQLVVQLRALQDEQQAEALSVALAKAQLDGRSKAESHRRKVEALEQRCTELEEETLDRMRIVAESVQAETDARQRCAELEEELADVRSKAGARMKELIGSNKALDDEVSRLKELEDLNASKIAAMEASINAVDADHNRVARAAQAEAAKEKQELAYARALVLRYLELEDQHEALFPAIAAAFRFTPQEVSRLQLAQEQHLSSQSLWGRTRHWGSKLVDVASTIAEEARAPRPPQ